MEDEKVMECYFTLPPTKELQNPLSYNWIQKHQFEDLELNRLNRSSPKYFPINFFGKNISLICYLIYPHNPDDKWKKALSLAFGAGASEAQTLASRCKEI